MDATVKFYQEFTELSTYLRNFALYLTKDRDVAEDLYQETALSAFRHQSKFQSNTNMKAWLSTIMRNSFINLYRKKVKRKEVQDGKMQSYFINSFDGNASNDGEMNINIAEIEGMIEDLDEGHKVPFLMAYQGYQYSEIQKVMNDMPLGTVKSRIHQARKILRRRIRSLYGEEFA